MTMPGSPSQALALPVGFGTRVPPETITASTTIVIVTTAHAAAKAAIVMRALRLTTQNRAWQLLQR
ncbi:MAG TPA: hypothetical protein VLU54_02295 [Casimicrobiaceae bacterium]|nr:hypothetical protein [Casimicrobiaceae bacterium]